MMNVSARMCMSQCSFETGMRWGLAGMFAAMFLMLTMLTRVVVG